MWNMLRLSVMMGKRMMKRKSDDLSRYLHIVKYEVGKEWL
jgi:hypothetical protein